MVVLANTALKPAVQAHGVPCNGHDDCKVRPNAEVMHLYRQLLLRLRGIQCLQGPLEPCWHLVRLKQALHIRICQHAPRSPLHKHLVGSSWTQWIDKPKSSRREPYTEGLHDKGWALIRKAPMQGTEIREREPDGSICRQREGKSRL